MTAIPFDSLWRFLVEKHPIGLIYTDHHLDIRYYSKWADTLLGSGQVHIGQALTNACVELQGMEQALQSVVDGSSEAFSIELIEQEQQGEKRYLSMHVYRLDHLAEAPGLLVVLQEHPAGQILVEISEEYSRLRLDRAEALAAQDELTGLGNRKAFDKEFASFLAELADAGEDIILLTLRLSPPAGGEMPFEPTLVKAIAGQINKALRRDDRVYRVGPYDFFILLPHARPSAVTRILERLEQSIHSLISPAITWISLIGASAASETDYQAQEMVRRAVQRMEGLVQG